MGRVLRPLANLRLCCINQAVELTTLSLVVDLVSPRYLWLANVLYHVSPWQIFVSRFSTNWLLAGSCDVWGVGRIVANGPQGLEGTSRTIANTGTGK